MPPSPAMRCSPAWDYNAENSHKRGHSFESGLTLKNKDDDLLLFNEMQNRERDKFLLHTDDDFEDSLSKLKHFSDFKLGINILMSQKSSDLLNAEGDKSDYDWLLTPPDTPLFPSLDEDDSQQVNLGPTGIPRSQPIPISRSFAGKSYQKSRSSSSPHRLSPSPRSGVPSTQMKGSSSSSALRSSSPPVIRSTTPTRRSSTPSNKPSSPTRRPSPPVNKPSSPTTSSSAPTLGRMRAGPGIYQSTNVGGRGASPVKANRGSSSPKMQGWQTTLSGFNSEAPPNLRTSLSDRPISYTRGSSPASRNGRESPVGLISYTRGSSPASRNGRESPVGLRRKSMSPTSSRSISSSRSQERDHFSCYSRSSMVSSGDDDEDSLHSIPAGISSSPPVKKNGALTNSKALPFSRKPSRTLYSNSVPKRSFDSTPRLTDQHKTPQNMFRPLLSSVPATTFRPMFSRNSSLTTSSNASSDHGVVNITPDLQGSELVQNGLSGGWERSEGSDSHEEVFMFDRIDRIVEHTSHDVHSEKPQCGEVYEKLLSKVLVSEDTRNSILSIGDSSIETVVSAQSTNLNFDIDGYAIMALCSICGKEFVIVDRSENRNICDVCAKEDSLCSRGICLTCMPLTTNEALSQMNNTVDMSSKGSMLNSDASEFHEEGNVKVLLGQHVRNIESAVDCLSNICCIQQVEQRQSYISNQHLDREMDMKVTKDGNMLDLSAVANNPSLKVDIPEGTGISVLLQRSGCSQWPVLQGRILSSANIIGSEPSCSRDNTITQRRSHGRYGVSASSSIDLGSSKQSESFVQVQLSSRNETDSVRNDSNSNAQSMNSDYDVLVHSYESRKLKMELEGKYSNSMECPAYGSLREIIFVTGEHANSIDRSDSSTTLSSSRPFISDNCTSEHADNCSTVSTSEQRILSNQESSVVSCSSASEIKCVEDCISSLNADESYMHNTELKTDIRSCSEMEEDNAMVNCSFQNAVIDAGTNCSSFETVESQDVGEPEGTQTDHRLLNNPAYPESSNDHSISQINHDISLSISESQTIHEHINPEPPALTTERPREMSRSLTLEEATDTILFCSSIIHDLAYRAATIAMEKESKSSPNPSPLPTATILGKPIPGLREPARTPSKHHPGLQQSKRKRSEAPIRSPPKEADGDAIVQGLLDSSVEITRKVDTAKPPKLESKCNCTVM